MAVNSPSELSGETSNDRTSMGEDDSQAGQSKLGKAAKGYRLRLKSSTAKTPRELENEELGIAPEDDQAFSDSARAQLRKEIEEENKNSMTSKILRFLHMPE